MHCIFIRVRYGTTKTTKEPKTLFSAICPRGEVCPSCLIYLRNKFHPSIVICLFCRADKKYRELIRCVPIKTIYSDFDTATTVVLSEFSAKLNQNFKFLRLILDRSPFSSAHSLLSAVCPQKDATYLKTLSAAAAAAAATKQGPK